MPAALEREYHITAGSLVKSMTGFVIALFIFLTLFMPFVIYYLEPEEGILPAIMIVIIDLVVFIPILIGAWVYSPKKYVVSEAIVHILRPIRSIMIPIKDITSVEEKEVSVFKTVRLWANGGIFSMTGAYYNKSNGKFWMYVKNNNYVMITADKKYVLSPDEKEQFIIQLKNHIGKYNKKQK
jgi:hypothetical protein